MDNKPRGREKNITGQGKDIYKRGEGLGTGPVGDTSGRPQSMRPTSQPSSSQKTGMNRAATRGLGGGGLLIAIIAAFLLFRGGGTGTTSTDSSLTQSPSSGYTQQQTTSQQSTGTQQSTGSHSSLTPSSGMSSSLSSILGSYGGSSVSSGWTQTANTGRLNTSVVSGARDKRTKIVGGGKDTITLMIYMCGTDLESKSRMATNDLQEMLDATVSDKINIIIYTGGCKSWRNNIVSSSVNQIYKLEDAGLRCLVADDGSAAMTKPATLSKFIKWTAQNYPADRFDIIFWDHGGGSLSGYGYDEKYASSGSMTLKGIDQALKDGGVTFDFIGFDACLMATAETGLMLADYGDYMIASEETEPGVGWYYTDWLTALSKNTSMPTLEIGKNICDSFVKECASTCAGQKTTLSVVDLAELEKTLPSELKSFATSTSQLLDSDQYAAVSNARTGAREFASSSRIDQVDLVHLCYNLGTAESKELADTILSAVKYNVTSSNMTNAYGLSIYFPYQKMSSVSTAVSTYEAIGMDSEYIAAIRKFASVETGGQAVSGGASDPLSALLGAYMGGGSSAGSSSGLDSSDMISALLGQMLGGSSTGGVSGLTSANSGFFGRSMDLDNMAEYLSSNRFDASQLTWQNGEISLPEEQWALLNDVVLNVFYDDGAGYIDLGLDLPSDAFTDAGALKGEYDGTWLAINNQPVPYYHVDTVDDGVNYTITGRVPVYLNGDRADLILVFDNDHPYGTVAGARFDYKNGETETIAKSMTGLNDGDTIDFVCDYYSYDGVYQDSYLFGDQMVVNGELTISNVYINADNARATYRLTDIYGQTYWTQVIE